MHSRIFCLVRAAAVYKRRRLLYNKFCKKASFFAEAEGMKFEGKTVIFSEP